MFHGSRSVFHDSRLVFMVIGWFISELSAGRRKVRRKEHLKRYPLDLYLGPTIPLLSLANRRPALA